MSHVTEEYDELTASIRADVSTRNVQVTRGAARFGFTVGFHRLDKWWMGNGDLTFLDGESIRRHFDGVMVDVMAI